MQSFIEYLESYARGRGRDEEAEFIQLLSKTLGKPIEPTPKFHQGDGIIRIDQYQIPFEYKHRFSRETDDKLDRQIAIQDRVINNELLAPDSSNLWIFFVVYPHRFYLLKKDGVKKIVFGPDGKVRLGKARSRTGEDLGYAIRLKELAQHADLTTGNVISIVNYLKRQPAMYHKELLPLKIEQTAWDSFKHEVKEPKNGCFFYSAVASLVYGFPLMKGPPFVAGERAHFWNLSDGQVLDLTANQYKDKTYPHYGIGVQVSALKNLDAIMEDPRWKGLSSRYQKVIQTLQ